MFKYCVTLCAGLLLTACASRDYGPATTLEMREYENLKSACYEQLMSPGSVYDPSGAKVWRFMQACDRMSWR